LERRQIELGANSFVSGAVVYSHVRLALDRAPSDKEERVAKVVAWLKQRLDERGDEPKKVLSEEAQRKFGSPLSTREFHAAYTKCYGRSRGRPRKRK
jgi:hypothetical protein